MESQPRAGKLGASASAITGIGLLILMLGLSFQAQAQFPMFNRPPRIRPIFKNALELYQVGEYEKAAKCFAQVQPNQNELTPVERKDLEIFTQKNNVALKERREGQALLVQAEKAQAQGNNDEANGLVVKLITNQYLAPEDRTRLLRLRERLQQPQPQQIPMIKGDARTLLRKGREALKCGDLDTAEIYGTEAEKNWSWLIPIFPPDSPSKLLRDVQAERARRRTMEVRPMDSPPVPERKEPFSPLGSMKNLLFRHKDNPLDMPKIEDKSIPLPPIKDQATDPPTNGEGIPLPPADPVGRPLPKTSDAREGGSPLESVKSFFWPAGSTPRMNDQELPPPGAYPQGPPQTALQGPPKASPIPTEVNPESKVVQTAFPGQPPEDPQAVNQRAMALQLIKDGFKALELNDLETARKFAIQAKELKVPFRWNDPNPERLLTEIGRREKGQQAPPPPPVAKLPEPTAQPSQDPRTLIAQAREFLDKEQFEEAEKLISQSAALRPKGWGLFEDSPDKLRNELKKLRGRSEREQSITVLAEARKQFNKGNLEEAKKLAFQAQKLHGPFSVWDFGDRPQRLIDDITRLELAQQRAGKQLGVDHKVAKTEPDKEGFKSASAEAANRNRAMALLNEARELHGRGMLPEARKKVLEARQLNATFAPTEESPDSALAILTAQCGQQLNLMLYQALELLNSTQDPTRFQQAENLLASAKQLCVAFGLDASHIDDRMHVVRLAQGGDPHQSKKVANPHQILGMEKLDKARLELKAGNTPLARRLAEEAFNYGVPDEAQQLIRSIDAEEFNQTVLAANRTAESGVDAFKHNDYRMASSIFASIDLKKLSPDMQRLVREILASPEMQPESLAKTPGQTRKDSTLALEQGKKPGKASVSDLPNDLTESVRALEKVQFDYFREHGLAAQKTAMDHFKNDPNRAIQVLEGYLKQLNTSQLDSNQVVALRKPVENRINQYRTLQAQRDLEKQQKDASKSGHDEFARNKAIQKNQEQVVGLMKEFDVLYKEHKFEEAMVKANMAKELDPDNLAADYANRICQIQFQEKKWNDNKNRNAEYNLIALDNELVPNIVSDKKPMAFDKAMQARRESRESTKNGILTNDRNKKVKDIERRLSDPVNLNFKDTELQQVISDLQSISGLNIVPDKEALDQVGVRLDQRLSLKVEDIGLKSALNLLLKQVHLTFVINHEVLLITTEQFAQGKLKQVVYNVADLVIPVENHPLPSIANLHEVLARNMPGNSTSSPQPTPFTGPNSLPMGQPVSSYSSGLGNAVAQNSPGLPGMPSVNKSAPMQSNLPDLLINLITNSVAPDTWDAVGGKGKIQYFPLGMALVVNQAQEVQEDIAALLAALRRLQDLEVSIEMRIVSVGDLFFERMGMDFDVNIRTPTSRREPDLLNSAFTPFGFVNRNLDRLGLVSGLTPAGTLTPDLNVPIRNSSFDFSLPPFGGYPGTLGADGGLSLGLAFLSDIQVFMFLEAAQGDRRTNIMQAPRITVFNGQTASIQVNDFQFLLTSLSQSFVGSQPVFTPVNQAIPIGVFLTVTPVVSADRRFVRLNLSPQMSNISPNINLVPFQFAIPQSLDGPGAGVTNPGQPVVFQMFLQQPTFSNINVNTTVNVPDGGTVLLGGLKTMSEARNEFGPPILSKIPYINRLFKNVAFGRESSSLMILVTPRIIINEEEEQIFLGQIPPIPRP